MSLSRSRSINPWIAPLLWIVVIFLFSTDSFSASGTSRFIVPALKFLLPFLSPEQLALGHAVCRKAGHVLEYFVLGIFLCRAFSRGSTDWMRTGFFAMALLLVVALSDEFHQSFVPSRTSALTDVGYDFAGGMAALLLMSRLRNETRPLPSHSVL
jgi:VanZ family protein